MSNFQFSVLHVQNKKDFLETAMELYGITAPAFNSDVDHVDAIIKVAERIEAYVYSEMKTPADTTKIELIEEISEEEKQLALREAFLGKIDSMDKTCGRGLEACDGSEGTCTCQ